VYPNDKAFQTKAAAITKNPWLSQNGDNQLDFDVFMFLSR